MKTMLVPMIFQDISRAYMIKTKETFDNHLSFITFLFISKYRYSLGGTDENHIVVYTIQHMLFGG